MAIEIIGAGFPRTGTTSLKKALESMGYAKTYHYKDLIAEPKKVRYWEELEDTGTTDFDALFDGFKATVDFPGYPYYKILMDRYPNAKVILTKRNFDDWYVSMHKTIWTVKKKKPHEKVVMLVKILSNQGLRDVARCMKYMKKAFLKKQFNGQFDIRAVAEKAFNDHIREVIEYVPQDRLLVYEVTEGWGPLCRFLNKPVPDEPFPHLNKKEDFQKMLKGMLKEAASSRQYAH